MPFLSKLRSLVGKAAATVAKTVTKAVSTAAQAVHHFFWDESSGSYTDAHTKQPVKPIRIRRAVDDVIDKGKQKIEALAIQLRMGTIDVGEWQRQMASLLWDLHAAGAMAARGGHDGMSRDDWFELTGRVKDQYDYLQGFAEQLTADEVPLDGRFLNRAQMYGEAARGTYEEVRRDAWKKNGARWERRILGAAEHCRECLDYALSGWQQIGTLPAIGSGSSCLTNCRCTFDYAKGEEELEP